MKSGIIVKVGENEYITWSKVVGAPSSVVLSAEEMRDFQLEGYTGKVRGERLVEFERRMVDVEKCGTSSCKSFDRIFEVAQANNTIRYETIADMRADLLGQKADDQQERAGEEAQVADFRTRLFDSIHPDEFFAVTLNSNGDIEIETEEGGPKFTLQIYKG